MSDYARASGISDEDILELLRVLGRGLAQAAESMRALPLKLVLEPGLSERDLAVRYARRGARSCIRWSNRSSATCSACTCAMRPRPR